MRLPPFYKTTGWLCVAQTHKWWCEQPEAQKDLGGKGAVPDVPCGDLSTAPVGLLMGQDWWEDKPAQVFRSATILLRDRTKNHSIGEKVIF